MNNTHCNCNRTHEETTLTLLLYPLHKGGGWGGGGGVCGGGGGAMINFTLLNNYRCTLDTDNLSVLQLLEGVTNSWLSS